MLAYSGSYVGTGTAGFSVTDPAINFTPLVALVHDVGNAYDTWYRTSDMTAALSVPVRSDAGGDTDHVTGLIPGGFTLGSNITVNGSGHSYTYLVLADDGSGDFSTITYVGDNTDDKLVFSSFQPSFALLKSNTTIVGAEKFINQGSGLGNQGTNFASMQFQSGADRNDLIGFFGGNMYVSNGSNSGGNLVNQGGVAHYGWVWKDVAGYIQTGTYTGNGTSQTIPMALGATPCWINIHSSATFEPVVQYAAQMSGGSTSPWDGLAVTGKVSGASATGFTVSSNTNVNQAGTTYQWTAIAPKTAAVTGTKSSPTALMMGI